MSSQNQQTTAVQAAPAFKDSPSIRFMEKVLIQAQEDAGEKIELSAHQKKIIQNSFMAIDIILKDNEIKRIDANSKKREEDHDLLAFKWDNIDMAKLAQDVSALSAVGLDPLQKNHVHFVPYKNRKTGKIDFTPIPGYRGKELTATKFGLDAPKNVIVQVVYKNDVFKPFKKDRNNKFESYEFDIVSPFDRGDIVGGFYYHEFEDESKNVLMIFSLDQILKRKPDYASAEFWGGEKDKWKWDAAKGKNVKDGKEKVEGWFDEMCYKTIFRAAYDSITIDSEKITSHLAQVRRMEDAYYLSPAKQDASSQVRQEVEQNAASSKISFKDVEEAQIEEETVTEQPETAMKPNTDFGKESAPEVAKEPEAKEVPKSGRLF